MTDAAPARDVSTRRVALVVAAALVACVAALWTTRAQEGSRWLVRARAAESRGDHGAAIEQARAAGFARCPGCSAPGDACDLLERIAKDAERRGDDATSTAAWQAVRAAELSSLGSARSTRRARADAELARLMHRRDVAAATPGSPPPAAASESALRAANDAEPSRAVAHTVMAGGAVAWAWALIRLARGGRAVVTAAVGVLAASAAFVAVWML